MSEIPVEIDAQKLCTHTLIVTNNLKNFPKKYRFTLVDRLLATSMNIYIYIADANAAAGEERKAYQAKAINECRKMKFFIKMSYEVLHPECSIPAWDKMVNDIESQLRKWRKSTR